MRTNDVERTLNRSAFICNNMLTVQTVHDCRDLDSRMLLGWFRRVRISFEAIFADIHRTDQVHVLWFQINT